VPERSRRPQRVGPSFVSAEWTLEPGKGDLGRAWFGADDRPPACRRNRAGGDRRGRRRPLGSVGRGGTRGGFDYRRGGGPDSGRDVVGLVALRPSRRRRVHRRRAGRGLRSHGWRRGGCARDTWIDLGRPGGRLRGDLAHRGYRRRLNRTRPRFAGHGPGSIGCCCWEIGRGGRRCGDHLDGRRDRRTRRDAGRVPDRRSRGTRWEERDRIGIPLWIGGKPYPQVHVRSLHLRLAARTYRPDAVALGDRRAFRHERRAEVRQGHRPAVFRRERHGLTGGRHGSDERHRPRRRRAYRRGRPTRDVDAAVLPGRVGLRGVIEERLENETVGRPGPGARSGRESESSQDGREQDTLHRHHL